MEQRILLTYKTVNGTDYAWFESKEQMQEFLDGIECEVLEAWRIIQAEQIIL